MKTHLRTGIGCLLLLCAVAAVAAKNPVPSEDAKGLSDPPHLKRFAGSVLIYRDDAAYDELRFPKAR